MPAYLIADETVTNDEAFEEYKKRVLPLIERYGGRFLSRGAEVRVLEAGRDWAPDRMVIIEFPTMSALEDWYNCADYAPVRDIRRRAAMSTLVVMDAGAAA